MQNVLDKGPRCPRYPPGDMNDGDGHWQGVMIRGLCGLIGLLGGPVSCCTCNMLVESIKAKLTGMLIWNFVYISHLHILILFYIYNQLKFGLQPLGQYRLLRY